MNFREMTIQQAIEQEVQIHGSLRAVAQDLGIDVGYLSRLASGEKENPGSYVLEQLRLEKRVVYVRQVINCEPTPLIARSKSA